MNLDDLRAQIDELDHKLLELLRRRAEVARQIGELKRSAGQEILDTAREQAHLQSLAQSDTGLLSPEAVRAVFAEIVSACRAVQESLSVAFLGPAYTFTHLGALRRFGTSANYVDCGSVQEVFEAVEKGAAHVGVVPVENSLGGAVPETLDCFVTTDVSIVGEHYEPIHHCLAALGSVEGVKRLHSHPQVLAQCRRWLRDNLPGVEIVNHSSTAAAAQAAAADPESAALASAEAAEAYGLNILARNVEDHPNNRTRFLVIGRGTCEPTGRDRTSLLFATAHRAGALHEALTPFQKYGVNMTMIQSRPVRGRLWEYVFFVDVEGHATDRHVAQALEEMRALLPSLKILGTYPAAE